MNRIEKQKIGMQQNNHSDKEDLETINQTPKPHNQKKKKKTQNTQHNLTNQNPETKNE